jgi:hypothetical protein
MAAWQQAQETERRLAKSLVEYALRTWGWDLFRRALTLFSTRRQPAALLLAMPVFDRWFAFTWIPNPEDEDIEVPHTWPTASLGVTWLASGLATASPFDQSFIVRAAESPYSAFLVERVCSGWSLTLRDLMSGRRLVVVDPEISACARPDDVLFSAVLTLNGVSTLLGPAPFTLPSDARFELIELRRDHSEGPWMTWRELTEMDLAGDLCDEYTEACERGPASILDTGGHAREPLHLQWTVSTSFDDMLDRVRSLSECYGDEEALEFEDEPGGERHALITWYRHGSSADVDDWSMVGFVYLDEGRLAADVPTRTLANNLIDEIAARLGTAATLVDTRPSLPVRVHTRGYWIPVPLPE